MHEVDENQLQKPYLRDHFTGCIPRSLGFSEAICQRSMLQKEVFSKTVNHFLLSDSTQGSNLWNSFG